ncbi:Cof-type HAD-IIB family hydrolase [Companilactobacillus sp.]|uniref:Cof-type HAD-IIB family hydrolase n=1 Tax=Companilactobacillus sp. TaxID=2767905 RepID=UPI002625CB57|nr:Cof-type HAD-IIB family hydrolase [Companilactobacillus sp.]
MKKFQVAFFDVDGTLAMHNHGQNTSILDRVPDSAKKAIKILKKHQILPVIATGRNRGMVQELLTELKLNNLIANNGRFVEVSGQIIMEDYFENRQLRSIVSELNQQQVPFCFETADILYKHRSNPFEPDSSMDLVEIADGTLPEKVIQMIYRKDMSDQQVRLKTVGAKAVKVAPTVYDITKAQSNKAVGVRKFLQAIKIDPANAIAFGDEENDLEMFDCVGYSVAMGNADEHVQKVADYVTSDIKKDGILNAVLNLDL